MKWINRKNFLGIAIVPIFLVALSAGVVISASNTVSTSGLEDTSSSVSPNQLKPSECNSITIADVYVVTPGVPFSSSGNRNDLILGTSGADNITAGNGSDCVVGGAGDDTINGNQRNDILLGGPGNDTIDGGQGTDVCYSGGGTDTFTNCETILP